MVDRKILSAHVAQYLRCVDAELPDNINIEENWLVEGEYYLLREVVETAINQSDDSVFMIADSRNNPIRVSEDVKGYRASRFVPYLTIYLN